jgi:hypothetical protein
MDRIDFGVMLAFFLWITYDLREIKKKIEELDRKLK